MGGTTEGLLEQTVDRVRALDAGGVINVFGFGGMPAEVAQRNLDTYVEHVLPKLLATDTFRDICAPNGRD
jgi:hypothetical protein